MRKITKIDGVSYNNKEILLWSWVKGDLKLIIKFNVKDLLDINLEDLLKHLRKTRK